jgi:outer membrane protein assembly factor BamA
VPKFTAKERAEIKSIVATLTIKRIPDSMIIKHIQNTTGQTVSRMTLWNVRQQLKKDSYHWYKVLREGEYEYLHEFKERINEIIDLQRQHHEIIIENQANPSTVQTSLAELHKLNITLSNYFDVAPSIGNPTIPETPKTEKRDIINKDIIV